MPPIPSYPLPGSPTRFSTPNSTFSANSTIEALGVLSKSKLNPEAPDFLPSSRKMDQNNRRKWTKPELKREIAGLRESLEMVLVPTFNQPPPGLMVSSLNESNKTSEVGNFQPVFRVCLRPLPPRAPTARTLATR